MGSTDQLEKLPNIGDNLANLLRETGINSPEDLFEAGAIQTFLRLKAVDPDACFSKLCALQGAVEGIRWHNLSKEKKQELKHFFDQVNK